MSKQTAYESRVTDGVTEYFQDGEKIAFINDQGTLCATHGNASEKEALKAWIDLNSEDNQSPEPDAAPEADPVDPPHPPSTVVEDPDPAFIAPLDPIPPQDHELDQPPTPEPGSARFEFSKPDAPPTPVAPRTGPPEVPAKEPRLIPGLGYLAPDYLWWAWHQPDDVFLQIYKKSKEDFQKDHGGYLDKIRNRSVNGGLQ